MSLCVLPSFLDALCTWILGQQFSPTELCRPVACCIVLPALTKKAQGGGFLQQLHRLAEDVIFQELSHYSH